MATTKAPAKKAAKKASKSIAIKAVGTSIANIDEQLNNEIDNIKNQIGQSASNKLSLMASGDWELPDGMNLGNEIQIVVVDFNSQNKFYDQPFSKDNPAPPACYAIGTPSSQGTGSIKGMAPEPDSPQIQSDDCFSCPLNVFGSGQGGKSKACQNRRVAAVLVVDPENPEAHNALDAPIYSMDLSPSNIKAFDGAISYSNKSMGHYIKVMLTAIGKNVGTYATVSFTDPVPNPDYAIHASRRSEVEAMLTRKPDFAAYAAKAPPARGRAAPRRTAGARR